MNKIGTSILLILFAVICRAEGELPGRFVINDKGDEICFSKGNLVYTQSSSTWSFAEQQYDVIGAANVTSDALADQIDLFGWSADGTNACNYGVSQSLLDMNYLGNFMEWGQNKISNGGNKLNSGWRTLTADEWAYLIAHNSPFQTSINGVKGMAIMPYYVHLEIKPQSYTREEWEVDEKQGVVFLPFTGYRSGITVSGEEKSGYYWTATPKGEESAIIVQCENDKISLPDNSEELSRTRGHAVRLVKDASASCTVTVSAEPNNPLAGKVTITTIDKE